MQAQVKNSPPQDLVERRRNEILAAAHKVFAEKGYRETNIADIASELGIGHGTFYRYFENKRDIAANVIERAVERVAAVVEDEDPEATNSLDQYRQQVVRIGNKLFDLFQDDPHLAAVFFYESKSIDPELRASIQVSHDLFSSFTERYLINGVNKGFLEKDLDTETTAFAINSMIFAAIERLIRSENQEADRDRWIAAVTGMMFEGMAKK